MSLLVRCSTDVIMLDVIIDLMFEAWALLRRLAAQTLIITLRMAAL
jgi:hypothetical protein